MREIDNWIFVPPRMPENSEHNGHNVLRREELLEQYKTGKILFEKVDLSRESLDNCTFSGIRFVGAILHGTSFKESAFKETVFIDCDLQNAILSSARLETTKIFLCQMQNAALPGAVIKNSALRECNLTNANLSRAAIEYSSFRGSYLNNATFKKAQLTNTSFKDSVLNGIDIEGIVAERIHYYTDGMSLEDVIDSDEDDAVQHALEQLYKTQSSNSVMPIFQEIISGDIDLTNAVMDITTAHKLEEMGVSINDINPESWLNANRVGGR